MSATGGTFDEIVTDFTAYEGGTRKTRTGTVNHRLVLVHAPTRYYVPELSTTDAAKKRLYIMQVRHSISSGAIGTYFPAEGDTTTIKPVSIMPSNFEYPRLDYQTRAALIAWGDTLGDYLLNNGNPRDWNTTYTVDLLTIVEPYKIVEGEQYYTIEKMSTEADSLKAEVDEYIDIGSTEIIEVSDPPAEFQVSEAPYICTWGLGSAFAKNEYISSDVVLVAYYPLALMLANHVAQFLDAPVMDLSYYERLTPPSGYTIHWEDESLIEYLGIKYAIYIGLDDEIAAGIADKLREAGVSEVHGLVGTSWNDLIVKVATAEYNTWGAYGIYSAYQDMVGDFTAIASGFALHLLAVATKETPDPISVALMIRQAIGASLPIVRPMCSVNEAWTTAIILARKYRNNETIEVPPIYVQT